MNPRLQLARVNERTFLTKHRGVNFWSATVNKRQRDAAAKAFYDDMRSSVRLRIAWTQDNGHVGLGQAGIIRAKKGFTK